MTPGKLLKWAFILLVALALALLIVLWPVLGINPFEGRVDNLCRLASNEVDFYIRFPAVRLLDDPIVKAIEQDPLFAPLADLKVNLAAANARLAREVNPQIPLGLVEVDAVQDFAGAEAAVAGTIRGDFSRARLDNFLVMTRVAWYARGISALKRSFVRDRIQLPPGVKSIEVEKGLYFKIELDEATTRQIAGFRSVRARQYPDNIVFLARIGDVVLLSDNDIWIEHALYGGNQVLPADPRFEKQYMLVSRGGSSIEVFVRTFLTRSVMYKHGAPGLGGPLSYLGGILPIGMVGNITLSLTPRQTDGIEISLTNYPTGEGFKKIQPHIQRIYDGEKADLRYDFSPEGIGRFIPRQRTVGALVMHADPEQLIEFALGYIPATDLREIDKQVKQHSDRSSLADLLRRKLAADLADTMMVVAHRPPIFGKANFAAFKDPPEVWPPTPDGQLSISLVLRVQDSVRAEKVTQTIKTYLQALGMEYEGPHESGKFELASVADVGRAADLALVRPAFGTLGDDSKYIFFSTSIEAAMALEEAAEFERERYVTNPGPREVASYLLQEGTVSLLVDPTTLRHALMDRVRVYARDEMDVQGHKLRFVQEAEARDRKVTDAEIKAEAESYVARTYPRIRDAYERSVSWLDVLDVAVLGIDFGRGPEKRVVARGYARLLPPEPE